MSFYFKSLMLVLTSAFFVSAASAQSIPNFDPGYIPFSPQLVTLKECGVKIAMDPTWPLEKSRVAVKGGKSTKFKYSLAVEYWKKDPRPYSEFVANPSVLTIFECAPSSFGVSKKFDGLDFFANHVYASAKKVRGARVGKLQTLNAPKFGRVFYFFTYSKGEVNSDTLKFYSWKDDQLYSAFVRITRDPGRDYIFNFPKGKVMSVEDEKTGKVTSARLTRKARASPLGGTRGVRTKNENMAILNTILNSFQGL